MNERLYIEFKYINLSQFLNVQTICASITPRLACVSSSCKASIAKKQYFMKAQIKKQYLGTGDNFK